MISKLNYQTDLILLTEMGYLNHIEVLLLSLDEENNIIALKILE